MAFPDASRSSLICTIQLSCVDLLLISVVLVLPTAWGFSLPCVLGSVLEVFAETHGVGVGKQQLRESGLVLL